MKRRLIAFALALALVFSLTACGLTPGKSVDLMQGIKANEVNTDVDLRGSGAVAVTDFAVRLFQKSMEDGESSLISPISVLCALAMTANGATGEARAQMEDVLGLPAEELNEYLHAYMEQLPQGDKYKLSLANAVWFRDDKGLAVKDEFLQMNTDYYGAGIFKAPFNETTCNDINSWVKENTGGMIQKILDEIPPETMMYLINAVAFDAEWQRKYYDTQVREGIFTQENGTEETAVYLWGEEHLYMEDDFATGFAKRYADEKYLFVAMLPKDGVSINEYVQSLTGERLHDLLKGREMITVRTSIPKFEHECSMELSDTLKAMGMILPFESNGWFEGIGTSEEGPLMLSKVLHKTYISVDEAGTKAGAATAAMIDAGAAPDKEYKEVYLDRPFVYMIVDTETNIPIFIGTVMEVDGA